MVFIITVPSLIVHYAWSRSLRSLCLDYIYRLTKGISQPIEIQTRRRQCTIYEGAGHTYYLLDSISDNRDRRERSLNNKCVLTRRYALSSSLYDRALHLSFNIRRVCIWALCLLKDLFSPNTRLILKERVSYD